MHLETLIYRRFTAATPDGSLRSGRRVTTEPRTIPAMLIELQNVHGLARAREIADVPRSTWNHLRAGRRAPAARTRDKIVRALRAARIRHEDALRTWPGVVIYARVRISKDDRTRYLRVGSWRNGFNVRDMDAAQSPMVTDWLAGNDVRCASRLERVVEENLGLAHGAFARHVTPYDLRYFPSESAGDAWANH